MYKLVQFPAEDQTDFLFTEVLRPGLYLVKEARDRQLVPEIQKFIDQLKSTPGKIWVLVNALGAHEYYGPNINNDSFSEADLNPSDPKADYGYKTFMQAGLFRNHANKDRNLSFGRVACAAYNTDMHRVELVLEVDKALCEKFGHSDLYRRLEAGEKPSVSMGTRVLYDVCSICNHQSRTVADHCACFKDKAGQVLSDGRRVFVFNPRPKFFDLSIVVVGADRTSFVMAKVARANGQPVHAGGSAELALAYGLSDPVDDAKEILKLGMSRKLAEMAKQVPALAAEVLPALNAREPELPKLVLDRLGSLPFDHALTSASAAGIVLRPHEFQRIVLIAIQRPDMADAMDRAGTVFSPAPCGCADRSIPFGSPGQYHAGVGSLLASLMPERSMFAAPLARRVVEMHVTMDPRHGTGSISRNIRPRRVDTAPERAKVLQKVAAAYNGYRQELLERLDGVVSDITSRDVRLLAAAMEASVEDLFGSSLRVKTAGAGLPPLALLGAVPLAYAYGAYVGERRTKDDEQREADSFIVKHPILAASIFVGLARLGMKLHQSGKLDDVLSTVGKQLSGPGT